RSRDLLYIGAPVTGELAKRFKLSGPSREPSRARPARRRIERRAPSPLRAAEALAERRRQARRRKAFDQKRRRAMPAPLAQPPAIDGPPIAVLAAPPSARATRAATTQEALEARLARLAATRRALKGPQDMGSPHALVDRVVTRESEGGSHLRVRRRTVLHDPRVQLPDDLRAAGLAVEDLAEQAERLSRLRGALDDTVATGRDALIADRTRTMLVAAERRLSRLRATLAAETVALDGCEARTLWDVLRAFAIEGVSLRAMTGTGKGCKARGAALRQALREALARAAPLVRGA
ncbi:MAG: hypothetical protein AAGM38_18405, partial [Pseudomonadota bacterium]